MSNLHEIPNNIVHHLTPLINGLSFEVEVKLKLRKSRSRSRRIREDGDGSSCRSESSRSRSKNKRKHSKKKGGGDMSGSFPPISRSPPECNRARCRGANCGMNKEPRKTLLPISSSYNTTVPSKPSTPFTSSSMSRGSSTSNQNNGSSHSSRTSSTTEVSSYYDESSTIPNKSALFPRAVIITKESDLSQSTESPVATSEAITREMFPSAIWTPHPDRNTQKQKKPKSRSAENTSKFHKGNSHKRGKGSREALDCRTDEMFPPARVISPDDSAQNAFSSDSSSPFNHHIRGDSSNEAFQCNTVELFPPAKVTSRTVVQKTKKKKNRSNKEARGAESRRRAESGSSVDNYSAHVPDDF